MSTLQSALIIAGILAIGFGSSFLLAHNGHPNACWTWTKVIQTDNQTIKDACK